MFALAAATHGLLLLAMLHARSPRMEAVEPTVVVATLWRPVPPLPSRPLPPARFPTVSRLRSIPHAAAEAHAIQAPVLEPQAASAPLAAASAASAPLDLALTREQLRAIVAGGRPTLAQSLARAPAPNALARIGGDDAPYEETPLPGGVTEVHVHGGCFRLVPTARAQYDPFNHANERLTAACQ